MTDYNKKTKNELIALCKERGLKGYASTKRTKEKMINLLKESDIIQISEYDKLKYSELRALCKERHIIGYGSRDSTGNISYKKERLIQLLKENNVRRNLYDYLMDTNPLILTKFVGNQDILKINYFNTNIYYTWKCDTPECSNTFKAIAHNVYKKDLPRKYCDICTNHNRKINTRITKLKQSGSIQIKFPFVNNIWSNENKKTPNDFSPGSNEKVKLKCPNKSVKHPDYEIAVHHIQENNFYHCPKCITKTSKAEMRIYSELKYSFKNVKWQQKIEGREADVIIEDLKLIIEIDGFPWHKDKSKKDLEKNVIFERNGYTVLRIRDTRLNEIICNTIICDITDLSLTDYNKIVEWINMKFKYNINRYNEWKNTDYYKEIQVNKMSVIYEESIEYLFPESKDLWDYEKNYPFIPSQFTKGSHMEIWLKCENNHSWKRKINHLFRIIKTKNHIMKCPECHKPKLNERIIQINGISYNSISKCCRELNIDRNILYKKIQTNGDDIKVIDNIQKVINEILKSKT